MRRPIGWVAMAVLMSVLQASPARAQGWRWLEKLSGPGDFFGFEYAQKIWCDFERKPEPGTRIIAIPGISMPCLWHPDREAEGEPDITDRIYAAGASVSYLRALTNNLKYASTDDHVDHTVQILVFEGFYDRKVRNRLDVGAAVGLNWFLVPHFSDFTRVSIEPRVTAKLFDMKQGDTYLGPFGVRVGLLIFTKGFKAEDFGAIPGTYESGLEIGPSVRFVLDFDRNPFR